MTSATRPALNGRRGRRAYISDFRKGRMVSQGKDHLPPSERHRVVVKLLSGGDPLAGPLARLCRRNVAPQQRARRPEPALHPHVVVSRSDGTALGGHLLEAHVRPTLEVVLTESPKHLHKRKDSESGLALIAAGECGDV
jgi:hypothetical protein